VDGQFIDSFGIRLRRNPCALIEARVDQSSWRLLSGLAIERLSIGCEPLCDAVSQTDSGRVAGANFPDVFRNAWDECVDVSAELRLAVSGDFEFAFAAR
jgi:hypothetical protein